MDNIIEKYSELKEELDGKNPFMKYALLKEELDNKDPLKRYAHIKKELDYIKKENVKKLEEDNKKREENTLGAMESLFHSLGGEESDIENQSIIVDEQPQELVSEEEVVNVEKIDIQEEQPINGFKSVIDVISKQEARKEKLQEQPNDPVSTRIEKLEKWIRKIAGAGAGSGEVRLLNLDDVNTTDLANNKYLKYNSSTGKFVFADASGGGSAHTIQNAGSDLTARDNLNFDGTYVIATDDSGNDQTDITLHASLLGSTSATSTTLADADRVVVNDNGTMKQVALTDFETYFESALDTTSNITTVGALDSGSITSGFGTIDTGSSTITTTGLISGGSLDIDNVLINGTTIGHTDDTDLITVADGKVTVAGELQATTLDIGGTNITSTAAELNLLDGVSGLVQADLTKLAAVDATAAELNLLDGSSAGSIVNSKGVIYSGTGTVAGTLSTAAQGNITSLGTLTSLTVDSIIINGTNIGHTSDTDAIAIASSGNVTISQDLAVSGALTISGGTTKIESTVTTVVDPIIHLQTASGGGALGSDTNKDVGLALQYHTGSAAKTAFLGYDDSAGKLTFIPDASLSSEVVSGTAGTIVAALEGNATTATTLATARTIGGTSFDGSANIAVALSATTTALASARTLGGVSFDGTANINLPGVNASGNQDTSGNADTATALATGRTIGMTGDVVWTSASFTGSGNVTGAATIQAGSVENSMLADDAADSDEIAAGAIDLAHMSVNSIDSDQYIDGSIDLAHMSANSVDSDQYVDGSIDGAHIANDAVDSQHYAAASIDNEHLADDAVGADELASNAVVTASIVDANVTNVKLNIDYTVSTNSNTIGTAPNIYSGTAGQTAFTIKKVNSSTSYGVNDVLVFWQGFCLEPTTDYTISGTTLTFDQGVKAGDHIAVRYLPVSG